MPKSDGASLLFFSNFLQYKNLKDFKIRRGFQQKMMNVGVDYSST